MRKSELIQRGTPGGTGYAAYGVLDEQPSDVQSTARGKVTASVGRAGLSLTLESARELAKHLIAAADAVDGGAQ